MRKIILTFGILIGIVCVLMFFFTIPSEGGTSVAYAELIGYSVMIASLASIFFAVKQYRDSYQAGKINFGKAFQIGILITLVASVIYVIGWEIYSSTIAPDFADKYVEQLKSDMAEKGMTAEEIEAEFAGQQEMMDRYKNNMAFRMFITFTEIFPVGLVISLICAIIFGVIIKDPQTSSHS